MKTNILIQTKRLILRTVTLADREHVASSWKLDSEPISLNEAEQKILWMQANHEKNLPGKIFHLCLSIIIKDTNEFIGWCGLDHLDQEKTDPALFYLLKAKFWRKGYATEAATALLKYAFTEMNLVSIHGSADPENHASIRIMENLGMQFMGLAKNGCPVYSITKEADGINRFYF